MQTYQITVSNRTLTSDIATTTSFLNLNLQRIENRISEINFYSNRRAKREILDGLSSVLKWLIGTPDAKDAKHYEECINLLEKQELNTHSLLKQQLQIISSTVTNFNETIHKISYDENVINENLASISTYLNGTNQIMFDLELSEKISKISIQLLESIMSLEQEIDDILASILFIKSGAIHPSIISSERLYKELLMSSHTRTDTTLVAPVTVNNIHEILESASITSYIYLNKLVYIIEFPLIKNERFDIYRIYPIPIQQDKSYLYSTILPEHSYLATSTTRQQYIVTDSIENCKTFGPNKRVCKELPVYNYNTRPTCEMAVLLDSGKDVPSSCEITSFSAHINTFQPIKNNRWIFILQHKTSCVLQCGDSTTHHELEGSGIIKLERGCKAYTSFLTLTASEETTVNISHPIVTVDIEDYCTTTNKLLNPPDIIPLKLNHIRLDSLKSIREQLNQNSKKLEENEKPFLQEHQYKLSLFTYSIGILMLAFLAYKICCCYPWRWHFNPHRHQDTHGTGCIRIFNNCFDTSRRRQQIIPLQATPSRHQATSCVTDDSSEASPTPSQKLRTAQSLF